MLKKEGKEKVIEGEFRKNKITERVRRKVKALFKKDGVAGVDPNPHY